MTPNLEIKAGEVVCVVWEDSASFSGWSTSHQQLEYGTITSAGILLQNTEKQIVLTTSKNDEGSVHSPIAVPWSCITNIYAIEKPGSPEKS